jgi:hypothetical protein
VLRWLTVVCSVVFTIGTAVHGFVIIDADLVGEMMRRVGSADSADGFTLGFRLVGAVYVVGNALGILAYWRRPRWLFWVVLAVNATQGLGWMSIPSVMWTVVFERYGVPGLLPAAITDGGGALLALVFLAVLVVRRRPWGLPKKAAPELEPAPRV